MDKIIIEIVVTKVQGGDQARDEAVKIRCRPMLAMHRLAELFERMAIEIRAGQIDALKVVGALQDPSAQV